MYQKPVFLRLLGVSILLLVFAGFATAETKFPAIGTPGQFYAGKFIWFDLVTDNLHEEKKFYTAVFNWKFRTLDNAPGSYTIIEEGGHDIAGIFVHAAPEGARSHARWLSLISVSNPEQVVQYVKQQGGRVIVPPANFDGRGTHVLFRDPQGAVFGVLKSASGDPADTPVNDGDFFWLDLLTHDPAKAADFYKGLAGYTSYTTELGKGLTRVVLASGGYARAGIAPLPTKVKHPGWLPYILVNDVTGTLQKVRTAGGKVLVEPRENLLNGNLAVIADPRGGVLGIVNWISDQAVGAAQ